MKSSILKSHLQVAHIKADLSHAKRLKVGAVLVRNGREVCDGRNGMPPGASNICEDENGNTKKEVTHAEANVILFSAREGIATNNTIMVCTHSPCFECAKMIVNAGIKELYYETEYRLTDSLDFLRNNNIKVEKIGA